MKTSQATQAPQGKSTRLFSILEVQSELSISRPTVNRLLTHGDLKSIRVGRAIRIPQLSLLEFIEKGGERHIQKEGC